MAVNFLLPIVLVVCGSNFCTPSDDACMCTLWQASIIQGDIFGQPFIWGYLY